MNSKLIKNHRNLKWIEKYKYAYEFYKDHGHLRVPKDYKCHDGKAWLCKWVINQRIRIKNGLASDEEIKKLDAISIQPKYTMDGYLTRIKEYFNLYGNIDVPANYPIDDDGYNLAPWLRRQRYRYNRGELSNSTFSALDSLGMCWVQPKWHFSSSYPEKCIFYYFNQLYPDVVSNYNDLGFELDIFIPQKNVAVEYDGVQWHKNVQRDLDKNRKCKENGIVLYRLRETGCPLIDGDHIYCLDSPYKTGNYKEFSKVITKLIMDICPEKTIDVNIERDRDAILSQYTHMKERNWSEMYLIARQYFEAYGNLIVPANYVIHGNKLGMWIQNMRQSYKGRHLLSKEHEDQLNEIGMVWDLLEYRWDIGLEHYKSALLIANGKRVKYSFIDKDGYRTGSWVQTQIERNHTRQLSDLRREKLRKANFFNIQKIPK